MPKKAWGLDGFKTVGLLILVLGLGLYLFVWNSQPKGDVRKFSGALIGVTNERVELKGAFSPVPAPVPKDLRSERNFAFRVDGNTKLWSVSLSRPPLDKLLARGGNYVLKLNELPRKEGPGSLQELKSLLGTGLVFVEASFDSSILDGRERVATAVVYRYLPSTFKQIQ